MPPYPRDPLLEDFAAVVVPILSWQTRCVLFKERFWAGLRDGSLTVAYRWWKRPSVRAGGTLQASAGLMSIDSVELIDEREIDDEAAREAGYRDRNELVDNLRRDGEVYRIRFHRIGDDPRIAMRERTVLTTEESTAIAKMFERNNWALAYLRLIAELPGTVSTELASRAGVDRMVFKQRVRRLKSVGLTESLDVGYRLSPRGEAVLACRTVTRRD